MENLQKKRIIMSIAGVILCGISIGMFKHASLGVDPFQTLMSGLDAVIPIRFGTLYVLVNLVLLSAALLLDRRKIGLATFINLFLLGYIVEWSQAVCVMLLPGLSGPGRIVLLAAAIILLCLSSSLYFTADLGVSTYDAVALIWSQRQKRIPFSICRISTDLICVVLGVLLCRLAGMSWAEVAGSVGIGTVITAFFMGPLITWFNRNVSDPLLKGTQEYNPKQNI